MNAILKLCTGFVGYAVCIAAFLAVSACVWTARAWTKMCGMRRKARPLVSIEEIPIEGKSLAAYYELREIAAKAERLREKLDRRLMALIVCRLQHECAGIGAVFYQLRLEGLMRGIRRGTEIYNALSWRYEELMRETEHRFADFHQVPSGATQLPWELGGYRFAVALPTSARLAPGIFRDGFAVG